MQSIKNFFKQSSTIVSQKQTSSNEAAIQSLQQANGESSTPTLNNYTTAQEIKAREAKIVPQNSLQQEKVLEIDVVQSSYIPQGELFIKKAPIQQPLETHEKHPHKEKKSLEMIESQKQAIMQELRKIDEEIAVIKGEPTQDINLRRREKEIEEQKARKQARGLVKQLKKEKKELEERKRKENQKHLLLLQQEEEEIRKKRKEEQQRVKQQRKKAIEQRMEEERRKRQQRKQMDKESNRLLVQLKKEDQILKLKEAIPVQINQIEQRKKVVEKRQDVNIKDIEEHQRKYIFMKQQQKNNRRDRSESLSHQPVRKYQKNAWIQKIQQEDLKKKEEEKLKELQKRNQLQKRLKYGELVKNIFLPKKKEESKINLQDQSKPLTPNVPNLPRIPESQKRVTESKAMKNFTQQNRPFATSHSYKKPPLPVKQQKQQEELELQTKEDIEKEKIRKLRQKELRRQTRERLMKLQNQSLDLLPKSKSKPKYQNYLGQVKVKRKEQSWKDIIDNGKLSKQEKYSEMLKKANNLQARAKQKEQLRKDGDQEAVNLYIGSIQAKLALLQKF